MGKLKTLKRSLVAARIRGRAKIKIWAIVKIQRTFRAYLNRGKERKKGNKKLRESKKRWKKKIEGRTGSSRTFCDSKGKFLMVPCSPESKPTGKFIKWDMNFTTDILKNKQNNWRQIQNFAGLS